MKFNKELNKKFNKLNKIITLDKILHGEEYNFDNGQVEDMLDINKENFKYTIIKLNKDIETKDYLVFMIIHNNGKVCTHQLIKTFNKKTETNKYYKYLCTYINDNTNNDIIKKCYEELSEFPRKNILTKIYGI